jgi:hypothetical protein
MERPSDSRSKPSLDEIVTRSAAVIAEQIQKAAALAKSEMDLQIDVAAALKNLLATPRSPWKATTTSRLRRGVPILFMAV